VTTTVYSGRVTNWPLMWVMNGLAVLLVAMSGIRGFDPSLVIAAVVIVLANLTMTSVRTTAGPNGVVVRYGVLGVPRFRFPISGIDQAEAIDVPRSQMGGWGIHWSPWRGTRLTIRSGPTLQLRMATGKRVAISAADPQAAAAVVNGAVGTRASRA
jgi:hypothetical protein